jgi:hypothetical protein
LENKTFGNELTIDVSLMNSPIGFDLTIGTISETTIGIISL